jgi:hypothetical protein
MEDKDRRSSDTIYDGVGQGSLHSRVSLNADLAVAELVIAAMLACEDFAKLSMLKRGLNKVKPMLKSV